MRPEPPAALPDISVVAAERRRPGRVEYTNPHLIALLRRGAQADPVETLDPGVAEMAAEKPASSAITDQPELAELRARLERLNAAWWTLDCAAMEFGPRRRQAHR